MNYNPPRPRLIMSQHSTVHDVMYKMVVTSDLCCLQKVKAFKFLVLCMRRFSFVSITLLAVLCVYVCVCVV